MTWSRERISVPHGSRWRTPASSTWRRNPNAATSPISSSRGTYLVDGFGVDGRETVESKDVTVDAEGPIHFHPPLDTEPSVLYLSSA